MSKNLNEYIESLERAKGNRRAALANYNASKVEYSNAFAPLGGEASDEVLKRIYEMCDIKSVLFSRSDLFICVSLLWFNPEALFDGKIRLKLAKRMARVLGVTHSLVYITRKKVSMWLKLYPEFYIQVHRIFDQLNAPIYKVSKKS